MAKVKLSDFLGKLFKASGVEAKDGDLILAASALKEIDLPEDFETKFETAYYTPERAKNELSATLKTEHFGHFATDLERKTLAPIIDSLPDNYKQEIAGLEKTNRVYNILGIINKAYNEVKTNGSTEDVKKISEKHRQQVEELNKKIVDLDTLVKNRETEFTAREGQIKTDFALRGKIGSFKLAPEFEKRKDFIADLTLNSLKSKGFLVELDKENSQVMHLRQNKDGAITDVYEGNTKVTLDALLEKELGDFIQKSNGSGGGTPPNNGQPPSNQHQTKLPSDKPMDLVAMRQAAAGI